LISQLNELLRTPRRSQSDGSWALEELCSVGLVVRVEVASQQPPIDGGSQHGGSKGLGRD
jgi:hypothetical protein